MLLFISACPITLFASFDFKTSYVTVYRYFPEEIGLELTISKHRMLLFITYCSCVLVLFNFISKHRMLLFIPIIPENWKLIVLFQNIVCYCLSMALLAISSVMFSFQNIVCYCLSSWTWFWTRSRRISKHRMLLFI